MTAFVIPNAVLISTLHAKHFFTSFLSRDPAFELMYTMWKQTHPALALTESENSTSRKDSDASETSENNNSITSDDEVKSISSQGVIRKKFALPKLTLDPMRLMPGPTSSSDDDNTLNQEKLDSDIQSLPLSLQSRVFDNSSVAKEQRKRRLDQSLMLGYNCLILMVPILNIQKKFAHPPVTNLDIQPAIPLRDVDLLSVLV
jgi:hypothetical protein